MTKIWYYNLIKIIFKWSLIYFLVLIFLEDLKKSFVSSHFSPHWFLVPVIIGGLLTFFMSDKSIWSEGSQTLRAIKRRDKTFILTLSFLVGFMTIKLFGLSLFGLLSGLFVFFIVYQATKLLLKELI